jgi:hypothetical protein
MAVPSTNLTNIYMYLLTLSCLDQGCLCIHLSDMFVTSKCLSDKNDVRSIWVNAVLTFDKVKLKLLCPWWRPHSCHVIATMASSYFKS